MAKEAKARIKINKLLEESGWRFFDAPQGKAGLSNFKETKCSLDIQDKKDLVRLIFKWIKVDDFKIVDYELYEPFKGYLEEREKGRDKCQLEEIQIVPRKRSQSCISGLSAGRWMHYRGTMEKVAEALIKLD